MESYRNLVKIEYGKKLWSQFVLALGPEKTALGPAKMDLLPKECHVQVNTPECKYTEMSFDELLTAFPHPLDIDKFANVRKELGNTDCVGKIKAHMFDVPATVHAKKIFDSIIEELVKLDTNVKPLAQHIEAAEIGDIRSKWCKAFSDTDVWTTFVNAMNDDQRKELSLSCRVKGKKEYSSLDKCFYVRKPFDEIYDLSVSAERGAERDAATERNALREALGNRDCVEKIRPQMFDVPVLNDGQDETRQRLFSVIIQELMGRDLKHESTVHSIPPDVIGKITAQSCYSIREYDMWDNFVLALNDDQMAQISVPCLINHEYRLFGEIYAKNKLAKFTKLVAKVPDFLSKFDGEKWKVELASHIDKETFKKAFVDPHLCKEIHKEAFSYFGNSAIVTKPGNHPFQAMNSECLSAIPENYWENQGRKVEFIHHDAFAKVTKPLSNYICPYITDPQFRSFHLQIQ